MPRRLFLRRTAFLSRPRLFARCAAGCVSSRPTGSLRRTLRQLLSIYSSIPRTTCPSSRRAHTRLQRRRQPGAARFERIPSAIDSESQAALDARIAVKNAVADLTTAWASIAAKMATVQLAVQASADPTEFNSTLEAIAATMRKYVSEIEAALQRTKG